ncbi:MAG: hypothetical protein M0Q16_07520 [Candidatus Cloacimonetes bacterium]|jgi:hypothetical protein|nr:hypothetical protein [Candidatus Cloacimonadota bacterium]MCK9185205.1 hypothetical protein [Candidatus Cloacimonadota bacterium]MCK9583970.1 hypothetical protein [Candidatus Cloacimonadota bacterium]
MTEKKKTPTWTDTKKALSGLGREELLKTIEDMYKLRKENKLFLHTRYGLAEGSLDNFKEKIVNAIDAVKAKKISFRDAKQAISDYKKATGDLEGVAELMVFYCEECVRSVKRIGLWEQYANGAMSIWRYTLRHIQDLPRPQYIKFWERLATAQKLLGSTGWGLSDMIEIYMFQLSPYAEEGEEEFPSSTPHEDMP